MLSYINKNILLKRPIVFLCGPYYAKKDESDRRNILLKFLEKNFYRRLISLIIDDFLIEENINDSSISVQLLEEVFAAISTNTYIYLDTMSAASELGLFTNHSLNNKVQVFLPYSTDIQINNVGYFVKEIMLGHNRERVSLSYYRPKIIRKAVASHYVVEHYGFINDTIPPEISKSISEDVDLSVKEYRLSINKTSEKANEFFEINYSTDNNSITINLSIRTLFYLVSCLVYEKFTKTELKNKAFDKASVSIINEITENLRTTLMITIESNTFGENLRNKDISITTLVNMDTQEVIKHIVKFIAIYHENDPRNGHLFVNKSDRFMEFKDTELAKNPFDVFGIGKQQCIQIELINSNINLYCEEFEIKRYKKVRTLCRYKEGDCGNNLRNLHENFASILVDKFEFTDSSFAYQKGKSIIGAVTKHLGNDFFIKIDVSKFFSSIDIDKLSDVLIDEFEIDEFSKQHVNEILKSVYFKDGLPLGFVTSPVLSEIFMKSFDRAMVSVAERYDLLYTRYADDILLSSLTKLSDDIVKAIISEVAQLLKGKGLTINQSKLKIFHIQEKGQFFKYLGINIVKKDNGNILTVGKAYKNKVAKEYLRYLSSPKESEEDNEFRFYEAKRIAGKLSFVKQVEGDLGYQQILDRIRKCTQGRVDIITDKILF